jgi:hypothetical protein
MALFSVGYLNRESLCSVNRNPSSNLIEGWKRSFSCANFKSAHMRETPPEVWAL